MSIGLKVLLCVFLYFFIGLILWILMNIIPAGRETLEESYAKYRNKEDEKFKTFLVIFTLYPVVIILFTIGFIVDMIYGFCNSLINKFTGSKEEEE